MTWNLKWSSMLNWSIRWNSSPTWISRSRQIIVNGLSCHSFWWYIRCKLLRIAWRTSGASRRKYWSTLFNSSSNERRNAGWRKFPSGSCALLFSSLFGWSTNWSIMKILSFVRSNLMLITMNYSMNEVVLVIEEQHTSKSNEENFIELKWNKNWEREKFLLFEKFSFIWLIFFIDSSVSETSFRWWWVNSGLWICWSERGKYVNIN